MMKRLYILAALICLNLAPNPSWGARLTDVRHPDLSDMDGVVREAVQAAVQAVDELRRSKNDRGLGIAFGDLGMVYQAHELPLAAQDSYVNAEKLVPDDARWPYLLGVLMQESGQFDEAIAAFQRSLADNSAYLPADIRLGLVLLDAQRFDDAEALYLQALRSAPENAAVLDALGRIALQREDFERAASYLEKALAIQPDANRLHHPLAMAYRGQGNTDKARENLAKAGSSKPFYADPIMTEMLGRSHSYVRYLSAGLSAAKERKYGISAAYFERALELAPDNVNVRISYARALDALGETVAAIKQLDQIIELDAGYGPAYFDKGAILEQGGKDELAQAMYRKALGANGDLYEARILLANGHMRARRYAEAIKEYEQVLTVQPENAQVRFRRALALGQSDQCVSSTAEIMNLIRAFPTDVDLLEAYIRNVAECEEAQPDDRENALNAGRNLAATYPEIRFTTLAALIEAASGNFEAAQTYQAQAIFFALRDGQSTQAEALRIDMVQYEKSKAPLDPWPQDHPFLNPPRVTPQDRH